MNVPFLIVLVALLFTNVAHAQQEAWRVPELAARAEARMKEKDWPAAAPLWSKCVELNPVQGAYWTQLATAYYKNKQYREAISAYEKALALRDGYPWGAAYNIACCYALLGDKQHALTWLDKSFRMGFRRLHEAREDADLKCLHDEPRFRELVALVDTSKMSRDQGWRFDIKLLVRELKRIHYHLAKTSPPPAFIDLAKKLSDHVPNMTDAQIEVGLMKLTALVGDGHTLVNSPYFLGQRHLAIPVKFYLFEEGLFITSASPKHKNLVGLRVAAIGQHPVSDVLKALEPLISRDNSMWLKHIAPRTMRFPCVLKGLGIVPDDKEMPLTVEEADGSTRSVVLHAEIRGAGGSPAWSNGKSKDAWVEARNGAASVPLYLKNRQAPYWFKYLPDAKTVFFQYNAVRDKPGESLEKFCARLFDFINNNDVQRLAIDLRHNDGGNNFLNRPLIHGLMRCDKINQQGKLFVIIGRNTFSAAQCCATQIERHTNVLFVGEPTGSSPNFVGETIIVKLPYSQMKASISDLYWQNSVAMDYRIWIAPQIYVPPTFAAYQANRDPVLEAILSYKTEHKQAGSSSMSRR